MIKFICITCFISVNVKNLSKSACCYGSPRIAVVVSEVNLKQSLNLVGSGRCRKEEVYLMARWWDIMTVAVVVTSSDQSFVGRWNDGTAAALGLL